MKIIVLAGGISPERNVSLSSGVQIASALVKKGHEVMLLDLWKGTDSSDFPAVYQTNDEQWPKEIDVLEEPKIQDQNNIGKDIISLCKEADKVFLALHGAIGENGKLQALLEMNQINFTGSSSVGSMLAMDKAIAKRMMKTYGILTPEFLESRSSDFNIAKVTYPCVIKPCNCGSSIGVSIVENEKELKEAIAKAEKYEKEYIIEEKIDGREFSVGILKGRILPPIEIIMESGFYDYENKYNGKTKEVCPANISPKLTKILEENAKIVHHALRLGEYSRIDFLVDKEEKCYCLEANTLPGMTPMSLFPQEAEAAGISFEELCEEIIN